MVFADIEENTVDVPPNMGVGCLNPGDDLNWVSAMNVNPYIYVHLNLRDNIEPGIHFHDSEPVIDCLTDIFVGTPFKPQRQQPEGILQSVFTSKGNGTEKA
jgi:hypothetical protein